MVKIEKRKTRFICVGWKGKKGKLIGVGLTPGKGDGEMVGREENGIWAWRLSRLGLKSGIGRKKEMVMD